MAEAVKYACRRADYAWCRLNIEYMSLVSVVKDVIQEIVQYEYLLAGESLQILMALAEIRKAGM